MNKKALIKVIAPIIITGIIKLGVTGWFLASRYGCSYKSILDGIKKDYINGQMERDNIESILQNWDKDSVFIAKAIPLKKEKTSAYRHPLEAILPNKRYFSEEDKTYNPNSK